MKRAQEYINALMDNVSEGHIASDEHRLIFGRIKEKLAGAADFESELLSLYKVRRFGDFALSLLWIAERVESNEAKNEYTPDEQNFVVEKFRISVGDLEHAPLEDSPVPEASPSDLWTAEPGEAVPEQPAPEGEETPEMPAHLQMETAQPIDESEKSVYAAPTSIDENEFGPLVEKFIEAMQSGADDREALLSSVLSQTHVIVAPNSGAGGELREFSQYLIEFLTYINENGFMDDVRVMNILSNVSSPVALWAQAGPDARQGMLAEGIDILKSFKSLFE